MGKFVGKNSGVAAISIPDNRVTPMSFVAIQGIGTLPRIPPGSVPVSRKGTMLMNRFSIKYGRPRVEDVESCDSIQLSFLIM